jgi:DNA-directed RNA polymerase subunit M/transcription elongation factor TFIIS
LIGGCPKCGEFLFQENESGVIFFLNKNILIAVCAGHNKAYYFELQIRSADEPATR